MHRNLLRRLVLPECDALLDALTARQHLHPHEPLAAALAQTRQTLDVCPEAIEQAVAWLRVEPQVAVGRLRRTELLQLARSIHRIWSQRAAAAGAGPSDRAS